ncbi:hypothetical protein GCM10010339_30810 [Streptomyces alanosinicus]|uniref:Uncharacterized protein n=1 Tax=Streptomyces alanosinicus TaxID=68171 RepID=A0A918YGT6_9ACTN|nr:hypothetical protein GCM10010339_30810 [Streptomyces alanosinicus]
MRAGVIRSGQWGAIGMGDLTDSDRTTALRITSESPSNDSTLLYDGQLARFAALLTGKSGAENVNDQVERLGNSLTGLLTFDNAARSSQPSPEAAPCARAESREGTGEPPPWGESRTYRRELAESTPGIRA